MNKQLLSEINRYRSIVGLQPLNEGTGVGEKDIAKYLTDLIFKDEAKAIESGIFKVEKEAGSGFRTIKLKPQSVKEIMAKDIKALTQEEKEILQQVGSNMVKVFGADVVAKSIIDGSKVIKDIAIRKMARKEVVDTYFAAEAKGSVQKEINDQVSRAIEATKKNKKNNKPKEEPTTSTTPAVEEVRIQPITVEDLPTVTAEVVPQAELASVTKSVNEIIAGRLSMDELGNLAASELSKVSQLQGLKQTENGIKILEERGKLENDLLAAQKEAAEADNFYKRQQIELDRIKKEQEINAKSAEDAHLKKSREIDLKAKEAEAQAKIAEAKAAKLQTRLRYGKIIAASFGFVMVILIALFGIKRVWATFKYYLTGDGIIDLFTGKKKTTTSDTSDSATAKKGELD